LSGIREIQYNTIGHRGITKFIMEGYCFLVNVQSNNGADIAKNDKIP
jgi:hypothetical protein